MSMFNTLSVTPAHLLILCCHHSHSYGVGLDSYETDLLSFAIDIISIKKQSSECNI